MKKFAMFLFILVPFVLIAEDIIVPDTISNTLDASVQTFVTKTWILSSAVMAVIQGLKKVLATVKIDISGVKSQALAILLSLLYVIPNLTVWDDGQISPDDIVLIIEGALSAVGGIYGYKILWRKKEATPETKPEETK